MTLRSYRTFQALILAGLGIYLFSKVMDGKILLYINQRFVILVLLASLGLLFLAQLVMRERTRHQDDHPQHEHHHDHGHEHSGEGNGVVLPGWALWFAALPLIIGIFSPERPLSASALATRGINTSARLSVQQGAVSALEIPPGQRTILDWIRVVNENPEGQGIEGQVADVTGFVFHDARLDENQFMVGRFSIACCVADAFAMGMIVNWPDAQSLPDNRWVRVSGPTSLVSQDGRNLPVINAALVEFIPEPEQPYLFP